MTIGVYVLEIHLQDAHSLKEKRQVLRRMKDRFRSRFNVSVAESAEHADLWQRGELTLVSVAGDRDALERRFESIYREAESLAPGITERGPEYLDARDAGDGEWEDD